MAYCLDEAIWYFGSWVEDQVRQASEPVGKQDNEKKQKRRAQNRFNQIMGIRNEYADPRNLIRNG